jgi:hypothetical protein
MSINQSDYFKVFKMKIVNLFFIMFILASCAATKPVEKYKSPNAISFEYHAYGAVPTLPIEVRVIAQKHCHQYGKNAVYKGARIPSVFSAKEIHDFTCETS